MRSRRRSRPSAASARGRRPRRRRRRRPIPRSQSASGSRSRPARWCSGVAMRTSSKMLRASSRADRSRPAAPRALGQARGEHRQPPAPAGAGRPRGCGAPARSSRSASAARRLVTAAVGQRQRRQRSRAAIVIVRRRRRARASGLRRAPAAPLRAGRPAAQRLGRRRERARGAVGLAAVGEGGRRRPVQRGRRARLAARGAPDRPSTNVAGASASASLALRDARPRAIERPPGGRRIAHLHEQVRRVDERGRQLGRRAQPAELAHGALAGGQRLAVEPLLGEQRRPGSGRPLARCARRPAPTPARRRAGNSPARVLLARQLGEQRRQIRAPPVADRRHAGAASAERRCAPAPRETRPGRRGRAPPPPG